MEKVEENSIYILYEVYDGCFDKHCIELYLIQNLNIVPSEETQQIFVMK